MNLDSKIPEGPIAQKWSNFKAHAKLVNPSNRRKYKIIVVGTGLAGASAAASLAEQGYNIQCFCYKTAPAARTLSRLRAVSTPPRTIRTTATAFTGSSTTP